MKFGDYLEREDPAAEIFQKILDIIFDEGDDDSMFIGRLSDEAKTVYFAWWCDAEIHNGGFDQFFFNSSGDHTKETMEALKIIGASVSYSLFEKAVKWFPNSTPDADRERRWKQMEPFEESEEFEDALDELDTEFYKYEDNIAQLVNNFVAKNPNAHISA